MDVDTFLATVPSTQSLPIALDAQSCDRIKVMLVVVGSAVAVVIC